LRRRGFADELQVAVGGNPFADEEAIETGPTQPGRRSASRGNAFADEEAIETR